VRSPTHPEEDDTVLSFRVDDMTCSHCASTITRAIRSTDANATVEVDIPNHLVHVGGTDVAAGALAGVIGAAGYRAVPTEAKPVEPGRRVGGGCGKALGRCC